MSGKGKGGAEQPKSPGALGSQFQFSAKAVAASKPKQSKLESSQNKFLTLLDGLNEDEYDEFREFIREELGFRALLEFLQFFISANSSGAAPTTPLLTHIS